MLISIHKPGRNQPTTYPPPKDVTYGELVAIRNRARKLGHIQALADLQNRLDRFFDRPSAQQELPV